MEKIKRLGEIFLLLDMIDFLSVTEDFVLNIGPRRPRSCVDRLVYGSFRVAPGWVLDPGAKLYWVLGHPGAEVPGVSSSLDAG